MIVTFVSQCSGRALTETRRILDQFAERRGERSWQTPITLEGLRTSHKLLRKTARKNTSVACFWIHRNRSELMWIVGNPSRFNVQGATPTNTTTRDLLRSRDENDWRHGEVIRLLAALAALFHDFGKASTAFQKKLRGNARSRDAYRHEWISLRLFQALVGKATEDSAWLKPLARDSDPLENWVQQLTRDGLDDRDRTPLKKMPPLARSLGWLIVSHHRLPTPPKGKPLRTVQLRTLESRIKTDWCGADPEADRKSIEACWRFEHGLPLASRHWRRHAARIAADLLKNPDAIKEDWLDKPFAHHMARLALMLADHYYSGESSHNRYGEQDFPLYANTDNKGQLKQRLDEHLIGVEVNASRLVRSLPRLGQQLPRIARHKAFRQRTRLKPFLWQNRAFELAESLRERTARQGFFGVNMASTGTGKTLANGRILYALADPQQGARFILALGLRTLTLQTGDAYRERMHLGDEDLAVLVGGGTVRELHELRHVPVPGSESSEALLPEHTHVHFEGSLEDGPLNRWLRKQSQALLQAPVIACTIDHLMPATEGTRGGHQILPVLRLMTSDLVLDEVDDFDTADLYAITRLVHFSGMLGSRVVLSSATLPPTLTQGLFQAYLEGRRAFQDSRGRPGQPLNICCAWFHEFGVQTSDHPNPKSFIMSHQQFVEKRVTKLRQQPRQRKVRIQPLEFGGEIRENLPAAFAESLQKHVHDLHEKNAQLDSQTGRKVSLGLIRMANIDPLVATAHHLMRRPLPKGCRLHLCVYHSQFPLLVRSHIEARLDRLLDRRNPERLFLDEEMRHWLARFNEPNQLFVVLATPVAEVGRDHDYDWAIVEPSSMRAIIQLAGRVRRHRRESWDKINLYLLSTNLKVLEGKRPAYTRPGYETREFPLDTHDLRNLLREEDWQRIDATPRIRENQPLEPKIRLADLEHAVLQDLMLGLGHKQLPVTQWWQTRVALSGLMQRERPFRAGRPTQGYLLLPDEDDQLRLHRCERDGNLTPVENLRQTIELPLAERCSWWGNLDDQAILEEFAQQREMELEACARRYMTLELPVDAEEKGGWLYHPAMGFSQKNYQYWQN